MKVIKNNGNVVLQDSLTKTRDITKYKVIKKDDVKMGFYLKILSDVLTLRCKTYSQNEFNLIKSDLYDVQMDIRCHEYQDYIVYEYTANFVSDEFLDESIELEVVSLFEDFYQNSVYEIEDINVALSTLKLSYDLLMDNHIAYTRRIAKDTYYKTNTKYPTIEYNLEQIKNFDYDYLNNCFNKMESVGELLFYHTDVKPTHFLEQVSPSVFNVDSYTGDNTYEEVNIKKNIDQANLCLYLNSEHQFTKYHMMIFSSILGGGIFSKLFVNVREKHSLCYTINSTFINKNVISVFCALNIENVKLAEKLISKEITEMKNGNIDEFTIAKEKIISDYRRSVNSYYLNKNLIKNNYLKGNIDNIDLIIEEFEKVEKQDIIDIASNMKVIKKIIMG
jgi:hypothetical protein